MVDERLLGVCSSSGYDTDKDADVDKTQDVHQTLWLRRYDDADIFTRRAEGPRYTDVKEFEKLLTGHIDSHEVRAAHVSQERQDIWDTSRNE